MKERDLILLIGSNPMNNYMVAKSFIKKRTVKTIWLIVSDRENYRDKTGYFETAKNLERSLKKIDDTIKIKIVEVKSASVESIERELTTAKFSELRFETAFLHYTDGNLHLQIAFCRRVKNNNMGTVEIIDGEPMLIGGDDSILEHLNYEI